MSVKTNIRPILSYLLPAFLLLLCCLYSPAVSSAVKTGYTLCVEQLIPSLFLYLVLAKLFPIGSKPSRLAAHLPLPAGFFSMLLLTITGGFPVGASMVRKAYSDQRLTRKQAKLLSCCLFGCGPGFLLVFVGENLCGSRTIGLLMLLSQILGLLCCLLCYLLLAKNTRCPAAAPKQKTDFFPLISSIQSAVSSMLMICGTVLFFFGIRGLLSQALAALPPQASELLSGFLEVTSGCAGLHSFSGTPRLLLLLFFCCFGGICVHLQVYGILGECAPHYGIFLLFRLLHAGCSVGLFWLLLQILPPEVTQCFQVESTYLPRQASDSPVLLLLLLLTTLLLCASCSGIYQRE
jgi:hypothetical protein